MTFIRFFLFFYTLIIARIKLSWCLPRQHGENRALYLKKLFHWGSKNFGIKIKVFGSEKLAKPSLVVSSHISWLEIWDSLYLWDLHYISKEEVKHFPIIGKLAKTMGSIFIARSKTKRCVEGIKQVSHYLLQGENVMLYPEGTTSDGTKVLPFKATYFSAALKAQVPVCNRSPCFIGISMEHKTQKLPIGERLT